MHIRELAVPDAFAFTPAVHRDERGSFLEWFTATDLTSALGHDLSLRQANCSVSSAGVLRGIHFAQLPPSQAKYVTCFSGAVFDVVVDIRVGSPTYGRWDAVVLDDVDRRAVYVSEGLGHAFLALTDEAVVGYLCSAPYAPGREHGIDPLDPAIGVEWPAVGRNGRALEPVLSDKDRAAPSLAAAAEAGLLPSYDESRAFAERLRSAQVG